MSSSKRYNQLPVRQNAMVIKHSLRQSGFALGRGQVHGHRWEESFPSSCDQRSLD